MRHVRSDAEVETNKLRQSRGVPVSVGSVKRVPIPCRQPIPISLMQRTMPEAPVLRAILHRVNRRQFWLSPFSDARPLIALGLCGGEASAGSSVQAPGRVGPGRTVRIAALPDMMPVDQSVPLRG